MTVFHIGQEVEFNYGAMFPTEKGVIVGVKDERENKWIEDIVVMIKKESGVVEKKMSRQLMKKEEKGIGCKLI